MEKNAPRPDWDDFNKSLRKKSDSGILIFFEGGEKAGKSTQVERLAGYLMGMGFDVLQTKEPGGGMIDIRKKIMELDKNDPKLAQKELDLFEEDRSEHYREKILQVLAARGVVISDRNYPSTKVYQGYGRGMDLDLIDEANKRATFGREADIIFLMDLDPRIAMRRISSEDQVNRFEKEPIEYHDRVRNGYLAEAKKRPDIWVVLDASLDRKTITKQILAEIKKKLEL